MRIEEFEPHSWDEIVGNPTAIKKLREYLPDTHVFLYGKTGVGKSTSIKYWAKANGYKIEEINTSINRGGNLISDFKKITLPAFYKKIIVLEEADGINWFKDGFQIFDIIRRSKMPVALVANEDFKLKKNYELYVAKQKRDNQKKKLEIKFIEFRPVHISTVKKRINQINKKIGIKVNYSLITTDVRQSITNVFFSGDVIEYTKDIFARLNAVFTQGLFSCIRLDSEEIMWFTENIPRVYFGEQIYEAFEILILAINLNRPEVLVTLPRVESKMRLEYPFFFRRQKAVKSSER